MIIDFKSKNKLDVQKQQVVEEEKQKSIIANLKNMLLLAEAGYIVSFASCGFSSDGRGWVSVDQGHANPHELNSMISTLHGIFHNVILKSEVDMAEECGQKNAFSLPKVDIEKEE